MSKQRRLEAKRKAREVQSKARVVKRRAKIRTQRQVEAALVEMRRTLESRTEPVRNE